MDAPNFRFFFRVGNRGGMRARSGRVLLEPGLSGGAGEPIRDLGTQKSGFGNENVS